MADFGLTEVIYSTNYFRRRKSVSGSEEKVPIRWMAPESIENCIYSEASDMVSFVYSIYASKTFEQNEEYCEVTLLRSRFCHGT